MTKLLRRVLILVGAAAGFVAVAIYVGYLMEEGRRTGAAAVGEAGRVSIGGPFELVDHTGRSVSDTDYRGKYLLVFFGFTHCPDICPTTLQEISLAMDLLGEDARKVQPLFITVDPGRDTPETLAKYVKFFHPAIVGLTGTAEQIKATAKGYGVYYAKQPLENGDYTMNHSTFTYLMGPNGAYLAHFAYGAKPEDVAAGIMTYVR